MQHDIPVTEATTTEATLLREMAAGLPLRELLAHLVHAIERRAPGMIASVLLVENGRLMYGAAPNLPDGYNQAANNHPVGEGFGSCGTAVHRRALVIAEDLQKDPLWKNYREIARRYRLGSCWSMPIFSPANEVIGTFALYYHEPRRPQPEELRLIGDFSQLAALAMEHHRIREALRDRQDRLHALIDDLEAIVWEAPGDTRLFTSISPNAERLLGYPTERWLTEPGFWQSIIHPEDRAATVRRYAEASQESGQRYQWEYRLLTAEGRTLWMRDTVHVTIDVPTRTTRLGGVMTSISRQREAEEEREAILGRLADQQGLLRAVVQELGEAVLVVSVPDGRLLIANQEAERILRLNPRPAGGWSEGDVGWSLLGCLRAGGAIANEPFEVTGPDGAQQTLAMRAAPLRDQDQRVVAVVAVLSDLTERQRAEASQRLLADAGSIVGSSLDPSQIAHSVAALVTRQLADWCIVFTPAENGGVRCLALAHRDPAHAALASEFERLANMPGGVPFGVPALLAGGPPQLLREVGAEAFPPGALRPELMRLVRRLGAESAMAVPVRDRTRVLGAIACVSARAERRYGPGDLVVAEEVARRAGLALENARLFREVQQAVRQREEFLSIAAHELKTPVAALRLTVQSMSDVLETPAPNLEYLRTRTAAAERHGTRLGRLIDELLDVSIIQAGRLRLVPESVDLPATIQAVVARFQHELEQKGIDVTIHAPQPVLGWWDPMRIEQVLTNLLSNAIKYGEGRPVRFSVAADAEVASLHVEDHGIGMSPAVVDRLFKPFERGVSAGHYGGLGLGLYITDQIVLAHRGKISVRSAPAEGAIFTVQLPRGRGHEDSPDRRR